LRESFSLLLRAFNNTAKGLFSDHSIGINVASLQSQGSLGSFFVEEPLYHSTFGLTDRSGQQILQLIDFRVYGVRGEIHWQPLPSSGRTHAVERHSYGLRLQAYAD
jgi:hypothetical protein